MAVARGRLSASSCNSSSSSIGDIVASLCCWHEIIKKKGATYYGIAMSVRRICEAIILDQKSILPISCLQNGKNGIENVVLSMPMIVGKHGAERSVEISLSEEERRAIKSSADMLKGIIKTLDLG